MPDSIKITIDGRERQVKSGTLISAALLNAGVPGRHSISGQQRTAFCGMGTCFECRITIDGVAHRRGCQLLCRAGMVIETR